METAAEDSSTVAEAPIAAEAAMAEVTAVVGAAIETRRETGNKICDRRDDGGSVKVRENKETAENSDLEGKDCKEPWTGDWRCQSLELQRATKHFQPKISCLQAL